MTYETIQRDVVVLTFWRSDCTTCREFLRTLNGLAAEAPADVGYVAVNRTEPSATVQQVVDADRLTMPVLLDPDDVTARAFGVTQDPTTFFVRRGLIVGVAYGRLGATQFKAKIDEVRS